MNDPSPHPEHNIERTQRISLQEAELVGVREIRHERLIDQFRTVELDVDRVSMERDFFLMSGLGRGRQGVVMEARQTGYMDCTTRHALKFFDPSLFSADRAYDVEMVRIARQVSVLQQLYHPNLVRCETFNEYQGLGVLVMELIEGLNIRAMLDVDLHRALERRLPREERRHYNSVIFSPERHAIQPGVAIYIFRKILRGLGILHRTGYIHSDIKPSNVMIDRFGTIKLIDFGRATTIRDPGEQFLASPIYMAPELHRRETITPQADIYSCGMILLEMLHGGRVVNEIHTETEIEQFKRDLPGRVKDYLPRALRRNRELVRILQRLLAVDLHDRYLTADQADVGTEGARIIHQQLAKADLDTDYGLELETYIGHRLPRSKVIRRRKLRDRS